MRKLHLIFLFFPLMLRAQDSTQRFRFHAIGIDLFRNVGIRISNFESQQPRILELTGQFTKNKRDFLNVSVGFADMQAWRRPTFLQSYRGYFAKVSREQGSATGKSFIGYGGVVSYAKVVNELTIQGNYFPTYTADVPTDVGGGLGLEGYVGWVFFPKNRLQLRLIMRGCIFVSAMGNPRFPYLAGAGLVYINETLSFTPSGTIQFFYRTKK
jgi:hypothetical protein